MNTIISTPFVTPVQGASRLDLALHRLGVYIDGERNNLSDLIDISGHEDGLDEIDVLSALHLDAGATPRDIERLLHEARMSLGRLVWYVEAVPLHGDDPGQAPRSSMSSCGGPVPVSRTSWQRSATRSRPEAGRGEASGTAPALCCIR